MYNLEKLNLKEIQETPNPLEYMCLCPNPNHNDSKTGSFFINIETGLYKCFACGFQGNVFELIKITHGKIESTSNNHVRHIKKLIDNKWRAIISSPLALDNEYLIKKRNLNNDLIKIFDIRAIETGIAFPLRNFAGNIIGFNERTYSGIPNRYYIWGEKPMFFTPLTIDRFNQLNKVFIVEGLFGVVNAYRHGYNAISFMGASSHDKLTLDLLEIPDIVVLFDNDQAGIENTREIVKLSNGRIGGLIPGCETDEITKYSWDEYNNMKVIHEWRLI